MCINCKLKLDDSVSESFQELEVDVVQIHCQEKCA